MSAAGSGLLHASPRLVLEALSARGRRPRRTPAGRRRKLETLITHTPTATEPTATEPTATEPTATEAPAEDAPSFAGLGVAEPIRGALAAQGITTAFPIQALALPIALGGHDIIGQARTGTGKTLAFGIPLLQHLGDQAERHPNAPAALVVVPTRELAIQVAKDLKTAGAYLGVRVTTLYGGRAYEPQIDALRTTDVVVGTPGRLLDLARQRHLDLSQVRTLILDEADKMLDLGFLPDVERILALTSPQRQTMLFSATMPGEVVTLARRHLRRPIHVRAEQHGEPEHVPLTEQHVFRAHHLDKTEMLARVLQASGRGLTMVFCRTRRTADQVAETLTGRGFAAAAVHGDLGQAQRERALRAFRNGKVDVLVATDVAARGLDVEDVTHVVNYECPEDEKAYLHRIGRTGRAGRTGVAVTFVDWNDLSRWKIINEALGLGQPDPPETYSTSEHLFSSLGIPAGTGGSLPRHRRDREGLEAEEIEDLGETGRTRSRQHSRTRAERPQPRRRTRRRTRAGMPIAPEGAADAAATQNRPGAPAQGGQAHHAGTPRRRRRRGHGRRGPAPETPGLV
jgi:superfamily II DNA/RNA helicase